MNMPILSEIRAEIIPEITRWLQPYTEEANRWLRKITSPAQASFDLGCALVQRGMYREASYRFKFTLWRQPRRANAWYNLAICHFALGEVALGVQAAKRALEVNPKNEAALYLLATLKDGKYAEGYQPHTTPVEIIRSEYANRAARYEDEELGDRGYLGHYSLYEVLLDHWPPEQGFSTVLDAGCGTGLLGDLLHPLCTRLVGMDLCKEMLAKAHARKDSKGKPIYAQLLEGDVRSHLLHRTQPTYQVIAAANVAPLMGGLAPLVDGAARALLPHGLLIFTMLPLAAPEGYQLNLNLRRFQHSKAYLEQLAAKFGLEMTATPKPLYTGLMGMVVVIRKQG